MGTLREYLESQPEHTLAEAVQDVLVWRRTGLLDGQALKGLLAGLSHDGQFDLRHIENELLALVAGRWAEAIKAPSAAEVSPEIEGKSPAATWVDGWMGEWDVVLPIFAYNALVKHLGRSPA